MQICPRGSADARPSLERVDHLSAASLRPQAVPMHAAAVVSQGRDDDCMNTHDRRSRSTGCAAGLLRRRRPRTRQYAGDRLADPGGHRPGARRDRAPRHDRGGRRDLHGAGAVQPADRRSRTAATTSSRPAGDFEDPQLPGWQLEGGASLVAGGSTHAVLGEHQPEPRAPARQQRDEPGDVRRPQLPDVPLLRDPARAGHRRASSPSTSSTRRWRRTTSARPSSSGSRPRTAGR